MSGLLTSYILTYGVDEEGRLILRRHCVWPTLRTIPNDTHASFQLDITDNLPMLQVDGEPETEFAETFFIHGTLSVASRTASGLHITRTFFPSAGRRHCYERVEIQNGGTSPHFLEWSGEQENRIASRRGTKGVYQVYAVRSGSGKACVEPGGAMRTDFTYTAMPSNERFEPADVSAEFEKRCARIRELEAPLLLDTGDEILDTLFRMCKIRAGESIFRTAGGLMHSPGGYSFYAATWCNDQAEYAGPGRLYWRPYRFGGEPQRLRYVHSVYGPRLHLHTLQHHRRENGYLGAGPGRRSDVCLRREPVCPVLGDRTVAERLLPGN